jgi:plastocyanin
LPPPYTRAPRYVPAGNPVDTYAIEIGGISDAKASRTSGRRGLAAAGAAAGGTSKTVIISHTGYTPTAVTITTGDSVIFKNADTVAHTVAFDSTTGVQCSAAVPLAIPAGQSANCTFSTAAKYKFSDPANNKKAFHGLVTRLFANLDRLTRLAAGERARESRLAAVTRRSPRRRRPTR